jgi:hypothetical protein
MRPNYSPIALKILIAIATLLFGCNAYATNWYVRPSSAGSSTGADWNNAWSLSGISWGSVKPGDTIWLAGGTYTSPLVVQASGSSSAPILIMRVTSGDSVATGSPGWSSSFDSQVVISGQAPGIDVPAWSYVTIDGHENSGSLFNNTRVYGIKIISPSSGGSLVEAGEGWPPTSGNYASVTNLSFRNIDLLGPYNTVSHPSTTSSYGFNLAPRNNPRTNLLFHDCRVAGTCESYRENMWTNSIIEYCYIADMANDGTDHEDVDLYYHGTNQIWRYNVITNSPNDGIAIGPDGYGAWSFYGNIYWNSFGWLVKWDGTVGTCLVYNNVFGAGPNGPFANTPSGWVETVSGTGKPVAGTQIYNNIFYYVSNSLASTSNAVSDYNAYFTYSQQSGANGEAHGVSLTTNPFVNSATGDYHLTAAASTILAHGTPISPNGFYEKDLDGNTRGANGSWYIGAYQYGSAAAQPTPMPPSNLRVTTGG